MRKAIRTNSPKLAIVGAIVTLAIVAVMAISAGPARTGGGSDAVNMLPNPATPMTSAMHNRLASISSSTWSGAVSTSGGEILGNDW